MAEGNSTTFCETLGIPIPRSWRITKLMRSWWGDCSTCVLLSETVWCNGVSQHSWNACVNLNFHGNQAINTTNQKGLIVRKLHSFSLQLHSAHLYRSGSKSSCSWGFFDRGFHRPSRNKRHKKVENVRRCCLKKVEKRPGVEWVFCKPETWDAFFLRFHL